jgi:hypothetical protein
MNQMRRYIDILREATVDAVQNYLDAGTIPKLMNGLAAEAKKAGSFAVFKKDFLMQIKHGLYYHWTTASDFAVDPEKGPRDMSSMSGGGMSKGKLMVTSHLEYWAHYGEGGKSRPYVAILDFSDVPRNAYNQVGRGFGNEFIVHDPSKVRVLKVVKPATAKNINRQHQKLLPQNEQQLAQFYELATGQKAEP